MPLNRDQLANYQHAQVLSIAAIQVECPACGHLCKSLGIPDPENIIRSTDLTPFILQHQAMDLVECLHCQRQFALPDNAFIPAGE